jgi:hypothetical protein
VVKERSPIRLQVMGSFLAIYMACHLQARKDEQQLDARTPATVTRASGAAIPVCRRYDESTLL